ncbi:hypothetical protein [Helicobacter heilmannii]|uniref:hypothetical protein n=2 Tax=Helicobacter heilmannii TaxID=35817 RepID=UPI0006A085C1|nr:hypothetical protein [Helicobacter heilmannii]GMB95118.1 Hypothetical protein NHP21011_12170 [Helicobacter heilmannii]CRF45324.1 hypothetical protein HHE014_02860 [Helicobacter heilmannii]CRF46769.1 hypothetical protein HHE02_00330 [Helicobacter heilmannii]CRF51568.1 hypothetical protein HHE06_14550 [Helicobacter heilmannii]
MSRGLWLVLLLAPMLFTKPLERTLALKKDETFSGKLRLGKIKKPLSLRWTLFKDHGLVVHLNINRFPYQFILYKDFRRNSFRADIFKESSVTQESSSNYEHPYFLITFKDFNAQEGTATLKVKASPNLTWIEP